jgi:hypothetical protein
MSALFVAALTLAIEVEMASRRRTVQPCGMRNSTSLPADTPDSNVKKRDPSHVQVSPLLKPFMYQSTSTDT